MAEQGSVCRIEATEAAVAALNRLRDDHGEIVLHIPGGAEAAGTPMCLPAGELRVGGRDVLIGRVHGVEVYEQRSRDDVHFRSGWTVTLDVAPGMPPGFPLIPAVGMLFRIRDTAPT